MKRHPHTDHLGKSQTPRGRAGETAHTIQMIPTSLPLSAFSPPQPTCLCLNLCELHPLAPLDCACLHLGQSIYALSPPVPSSSPPTIPICGKTWPQGKFKKHKPEAGLKLPGKTWLQGSTPARVAPLAARLRRFKQQSKPHGQVTPEINYSRISGGGPTQS